MQSLPTSQAAHSKDYETRPDRVVHFAPNTFFRPRTYGLFLQIIDN